MGMLDYILTASDVVVIAGLSLLMYGLSAVLKHHKNGYRRMRYILLTCLGALVLVNIMAFLYDTDIVELEPRVRVSFSLGRLTALITFWMMARYQKC